MPTRLLIIADTHVPERARDLPAQGREARCSARYPDLDVLVFGHSHIPWDTTTGTGLRLLNPGSPTDRRRQPHCTYMTAVAVDGRLEDVQLHRLFQRAVPGT
ncbi:metallophosphoesterase family protein [Nocardioides sp. HM23]|uniref:metallophosphoesterase family protein n=1 Tax=Nocardioides bizhenqiangii TaxID=3095076 RepID=UPI002ACA16DC|nr:metallophosphoesterase family protein [Nocardioides sp. HM23]MDZ5620412.1 metallophosphoesterase family protein [Nocardioides sp. HM23]